MLTETDKNLIDLLKSLGLDKETTVAISVLAKTDEIREQLIQEIIYRYDQKGEVTEQDIQKMAMMLTCEKKPEYKQECKVPKVENCVILSGEAYTQRIETFSDATIELILDTIGESNELAKEGTAIVSNLELTEEEVVQKLMELKKFKNNR